MVRAPLVIATSSPAETARLAAAIGRRLRAGDTVLLHGPIGAGKTHFCRHLIRPLLVRDEEIPSPTFTLIQTYDTPNGEIWHADLYRLGNASEVAELGLEDAFENAICLVEWPDRLAAPTAAALDMTFSEVAGLDDTRQITFNWSDPKWNDRLDFLGDD